MNRTEKMAFGANSPLYNNVRRAGHDLGLLLGEGLIGTIAFQIAKHHCENETTSPQAVVDYSRECGAQDNGEWRALTLEEAKTLLKVRPIVGG